MTNWETLRVSHWQSEVGLDWIAFAIPAMFFIINAFILSGSPFQHFLMLFRNMYKYKPSRLLSRLLILDLGILQWNEWWYTLIQNASQQTFTSLFNDHIRQNWSRAPVLHIQRHNRRLVKLWTDFCPSPSSSPPKLIVKIFRKKHNMFISTLYTYISGWDVIADFLHLKFQSVFQNESDDHINVQTCMHIYLPSSDYIRNVLSILINITDYEYQKSSFLTFSPLIRNMWNHVWCCSQILFDLVNKSVLILKTDLRGRG